MYGNLWLAMDDPAFGEGRILGNNTSLKKSQILTNELYLPEEASQLLGVKTDTVKDYLREGKLEGRQIGPRKEWRVLGKSILAKRKEFGLD